MAGCEGCYPEIKKRNEERQNTEDVAQAAANRTGEWVGIIGNDIFIGAETVGKPIVQWVTPNVRNTSIQHV